MNNEFREIDIIVDFIKFLREEKKFPEGSIIQEFPISDNENKKRYIADLVLYDINNKQFIGLIEFKKLLNKISKTTSFDQVTTYLRLMGNQELHTYLVGCDANNKLLIYVLNSENEWQEISKENFPNYESLSAIQLTKTKDEIKKYQKDNIDKFKVVCFILAASTFLLFGLSVFNVFTLRNNEMALFGTTVALIIIPYAAKLKIFGVEFERNKE